MNILDTAPSSKNSVEALASGCVGDPAEQVDAAAIDAMFLEFLLHRTDMQHSSFRNELAHQHLRELLVSETFDVRQLPRLPDIAPRLLAMLKSEDVTGHELSRLIEKDPQLLGEIVHAANNVGYGAKREITTLRQAIVQIGHQNLLGITVKCLIRPVHVGFEKGSVAGSVIKKLAELSEHCADECRHRLEGLSTDWEALLLGTFYHVGAAMLVSKLKHWPTPDFCTTHAGYVDDFQTLARLWSCQAARHWAFPESVQRALNERLDSPDARDASALSIALRASDIAAKISLLEEAGILACADAEPA